jgi:hypothetical protein
MGAPTSVFGQRKMATSTPVAIASDQTPVPVSGTFGPPVVLGQAHMAASLPVVLADNQSAVPVDLQVYDGSAWVPQLTPTVFKPLSAVLITGETTIWTPTGGKKFRVMGFVITQTVLTGNVTIRDNTAGTTILVIPAAPVGQSQNISLGNGILSGAINNVLTAQGVATEVISGFVYGQEV